MAGPKKRILVVDDEQDLCEFLKKRLERNNFKVATANSGQQCLEVVDKFRPDIVLLDIVMPIMDGYQVVSKLKQSYKTRDIPIIMHSVRKETNSIFKSMDLGSIDYVIKPVNFETLLKVIKRYA